MSTVTAFEAKTRFGDLLERVSRGEEIVITRHDKPVARMIPEGRPRSSEIQSAGRELRAIQDELKNRPGFRRLTPREIRTAIETGRR
jgi:prevent-host-death family protein